MKIYVRKIFPHDITHEVSVTKDVVVNFFSGQRDGLLFEGKNAKTHGEVTINNATDPRFGGAFKDILLGEGSVEINDIVLVYRQNKTNYVLELVKRTDERYFGLMMLFRGDARHGFLETDERFNPIES